ncbi:hypothetical protein ANFP_19070 [Acidithiobacillus ferrooxidans]|nr:hypothetical protein ANFP_19070 [Acidithiobacillus ferrooxidans]
MAERLIAPVLSPIEPLPGNGQGDRNQIRRIPWFVRGNAEPSRKGSGRCRDQTVPTYSLMARVKA